MKKERLWIGALAAQAGVNIQTVRYYERRGLLEEPKRTPSGYREYHTDTVRLIRFVRRAQDLGFALSEIEALLRLRESGPRNRSQVRVVAEAKIRDIEDKILFLRSMLQPLRTLVQSCGCEGSELQCPILEALDDDRLASARVGIAPARRRHGRRLKREGRR